MTKKTISICIPAFNEAQNVPIAINAVEEVFKKNLPGYLLELIITDNASTDETWKKIQSLAADRPNLKAYRFSRNFGYQNSVFTGLSLATGAAVIEMDADLEDPPHVIPQFVEKWESGFEVVYGVRSKRHGSLMKRFLFSIFYKLLNLLSEYEIPKNAGDFRLLDRKVVDALKHLPEHNLYLRGLVVYLGFKQTPIVYARQPRHSGKSKFRFFHYIILAIDAITAFTKFPLRLIGVMGVLMFLASFALSMHYLFGFFKDGTPIAGFTTLVILILALHSITFIFLGVIGEYLSRIFDDSKKRPRVIISESIHDPDYPKSL